ncbi:hypothetical protein L207DRAFT_508346 [Hyaloscypha variabilis F]|uniref:C2H2-type domain-containing protein n=1 Tax=Hyaloscypha variabilis (strain UAMH 11265 / GT02V1 / F) TaxID=1149755 RepID=A0A2J6S3W5_HYAVF|nr:hypothetical protein L207DRAFT_508346 [Hyaloscypha variabilis F]
MAEIGRPGPSQEPSSNNWLSPGTSEPYADTLGTIPDDVLSGNTCSAFSLGLVPSPGGERIEEIMTSPTNRSTSPCRDCGESFNPSIFSDYGKEWHAKEHNHGAFSCHMTGCIRTFISRWERDVHQAKPHISGHGRIPTSTPNDCVECSETLRTKADLLRHAKESQHQPYGCECGALFSRLDVLHRHLESFSNEDPKYPCKYCKLHRGPNGFRRMDHLKQHIRNYHHLETDDETIGAAARLKYVFPVCSHPECPQFRDETFKKLPRKAQAENKPFSSQSAYTKHMRDEHNECAFPCDVPGCTRIGRRGYFREKDLLKHRRQEHPDAPNYEVTQRELRLRCTESGCDALLDPSSMEYHLLRHECRAWQPGASA